MWREKSCETSANNRTVDQKTQAVHNRPLWNEYFMELAKTAARRATCDRAESEEMVRQTGVKLDFLNEEVLGYENQKG
jgi:hypothetical protein